MTNAMHVLIVDDHPLFREGLKGLLLGLSPDVVVDQAASIQEADLMASQHFDLVLMDLSMPGTSGMQALERIKSLYEDASVVGISGDESPDTIQRAIQAGAAGYIPKSTDPGLTTQALKLVLAHGIYLPREAMGQSAPNQAANLDRAAPAAHSTSGVPEWSSKLSPRQIAVLRCLLQGKPNKVIAREIGIAEGTVKAHLWAVYQLLGVNNRAQAMYRAHELGLFGMLPQDTTEKRSAH